ncbi:MAG: amidase [Thermomicrobiales bacterium]
MSASDDLCYLTISQAASLIRRGALSPVELTQAHLDRIERLDGRLGCFITVAADAARAEARAAEREIAAGHYRGLLHGIPIAHKDNLATAGLRTTGASRVHADWVPRRDAASVARLRTAGAVLLGKLMLSEFAFGYADPDGALFREARNPWSTRHVPGGCSSGSAAALAAGLCMGSLGGDTGGSIRGPAGNCNVVGLKPTYDLVSRDGAFPAAWSLDHIGPMTRTVRDNAIMLRALAAHDQGDDSETLGATDYTVHLEGGVAGLRVGVPTTYLETLPDLASDVRVVFEAALACLKALGAHVVPVDVAHLETNLVDAVYWTILRAEVYSAHRTRLLSRPEDYGRLLRRRLRLGALVTAEEYLLAQRGRSLLRRGLLRALDQVDLIVTPTSTRPPRTFEAMNRDPDPLGSGLNRIYNLAGVPAISVPAGFSRGGLPIGIEFAGRPFAESTVYQLARAYEQANPWHTMHPNLGPTAAPTSSPTRPELGVAG